MCSALYWYGHWKSFCTNDGMVLVLQRRFIPSPVIIIDIYIYIHKWSNDACTCECTIRYDLHRRNRNIMLYCCIADHRYWVHSKQVRVSGYKPYWNDQMTPILINALSDMICIGVIATLCCIAPHRYWVHSKQVWVSGYKPYWGDQMTPILMNTLSDMICIDVIATMLHFRS